MTIYMTSPPKKSLCTPHSSHFFTPHQLVTLVHPIVLTFGLGSVSKQKDTGVLTSIRQESDNEFLNLVKKQMRTIIYSDVGSGVGIERSKSRKTVSEQLDLPWDFRKETPFRTWEQLQKKFGRKYKFLKYFWVDSPRGVFQKTLVGVTVQNWRLSENIRFFIFKHGISLTVQSVPRKNFFPTLQISETPKTTLDFDLAYKRPNGETQGRETPENTEKMENIILFLPPQYTNPDKQNDISHGPNTTKMENTNLSVIFFFIFFTPL